MFQPVWASFVTLGVGGASWIVASLAVIALTACAVSYFVPARFWRWACFPFMAQAVVMVAQGAAGGSGASLLPLGLIMFGIFGAFCVIPAAIGASFGRKASAAKVVVP